jgi:hypothetical protein
MPKAEQDADEWQAAMQALTLSDIIDSPPGGFACRKLWNGADFQSDPGFIWRIPAQAHGDVPCLPHVL